MMMPFTEEVIQIIASIPPGKVMTYGQIARVAGSPRAARQVVRIIHSMSEKYKLPWHRVINAGGKIAIQDQRGAAVQKLLLLNEGVEFSEDEVINLRKFQYQGYIQGTG